MNIWNTLNTVSVTRIKANNVWGIFCMISGIFEELYIQVLCVFSPAFLSVPEFRIKTQEDLCFIIIVFNL